MRDYDKAGGIVPTDPEMKEDLIEDRLLTLMAMREFHDPCRPDPWRPGAVAQTSAAF